MRKRIMALGLAALMMMAALTGCGDKANDDISVLSREEGSGTRGAFVELMGIEEEDENGENVEYTVKKKGVWRVLSLIPGIGAIVAFILTENMRNPMVFTDRWTLLMVIIAVIQVIVAILAKKEKEEPDDREAQA